MSVMSNHSNHTMHTNTSTQFTIYNAHQHFIYSYVSIMHTVPNQQKQCHCCFCSFVFNEYFNISRLLHFSKHTLPQTPFYQLKQRSKICYYNKAFVNTKLTQLSPTNGKKIREDYICTMCAISAFCH